MPLQRSARSCWKSSCSFVCASLYAGQFCLYVVRFVAFNSTVSVTVTDPSALCVVSRFIANSTAKMCLHLLPFSQSGHVQDCLPSATLTTYFPFPLIDGTSHDPFGLRASTATFAMSWPRCSRALFM